MDHDARPPDAAGHHPLHPAHDGPALARPRLIGRRRAMSLLGAGLVTLVSCSSDDDSAVGDDRPSTSAGGPAASGVTTAPTTAAPATDEPAGSGADCDTPVPEETAGPYPGDGSNGPDVLREDGVVRRDITSSFGSSSGTAEGVPLTIDLTLVDGTAACAPLAGAAVYVWHCDRDARYSLYSEGAEDQNYLRGVQEADADGRIRFDSIFPGAYAGRWPHVHFEVFASLAEATSGAAPITTSQLAFPQDACELVYATDGYEASVANLADTPLDSDMVFRDGVDEQMATLSGDVTSGLTASLTLTP
jgi:protocatechuate 3,4-dioxygenase beta subunit